MRERGVDVGVVSFFKMFDFVVVVEIVGNIVGVGSSVVRSIVVEFCDIEV